jgi:hypothetical protein
MKDTNKKEFEFLNNIQDNKKAPLMGQVINILYNIVKGFMWFVYGLTCVICTTIEIITWIFCILTIPRRRKRRRKKGWF